jgi:exonuclease SbcC
MRPLALRLSGFRSYRAEREVSFRGLDLVAIIGDTGAGKSSLLEAMTWALYGASTWSKKASSELLAHGAKRMSVALDFEADGEEWRITRTFARSTGAGSAELRCLSDPAIAKVDGVRMVDPRIEELLGLSYEVFCSCVLLPQGKFERLLKAKPAERTDTLKSILRLEQLAEARAVADRYAVSLAARERELLEARGRFREDPTRDVALAEARLAELAPEQASLETLSAQVDELAKSGGEHNQQARVASAEAERLVARQGGRARALRALAGRARELEAEHRRLAAAAEAAHAAAEQLDHEHEIALRDGSDASTLARLESTLGTMRGLLARQDEVLKRISQEHHRHDDAAKEIDLQRRALAEAEAALERHDDSLAAARRAVDQAAATLVQGRAAVDALDAAAAATSSAEQALSQTREVAKHRDAEHAEANRRLADAEADRDRTVHAHEVQVREQAAAHAAATCAPGDPCPVCARPLPDGFVAPNAPDLAAAAEAQRAAFEALQRVGADERETAMQARDAANHVASAERALALARGAQEAALESVTTLPGVSTALDPGAAAHAAVATLTAGAAEASALVARLEGERRDAEARAEEHRLAIARAETAREGHERVIGGLREELAATTAELESAAATVPVDTSDSTRLEEAVLATGTRLERARIREQRREEARAAAAEAVQARSRAELALQTEVATPAAAKRAELIALASELPHGVIAEPPPDAGPGTLVAIAETLEAAIDARIAELRHEADAARDEGQRALQESRDLVTNAGFTDRDALAARFDEVRALVFAETRERRAAAAQVVGAARLDALKTRARELQTAFEALKDALADRGFVGFVVQRRQRALLVHASKVLDEITGRYAFTEDFRILDRESGLPRSPDTLSGGETFIASLALALGLVEVADRSGGDLRALFLDEGFGTLDAAILETAITALEERAKSGRLIGVISHVPTVAERIETVMEIRHAVEGSTVSILSASERERALDGAAAEVAAL